MKKKKSLIKGLSFSPSRALGISQAKTKVAKATGIPTNKAGRHEKLAKCLVCNCIRKPPRCW